MNKAEATKILALLQAAYPAFYRDTTDKEKAAAVYLWSDMFAEESYQEVSAAVKAMVLTRAEGYPPTIGAVNQMLTKIKKPDRLTPHEAWNLAAKAASGNMAWNDLPDMVQKAIGSPSTLREWGAMDLSAFNSVVYSNFLKAYTALDSREKEQEMLPQTIKSMLPSFSMKAIEG